MAHQSSRLLPDPSTYPKPPRSEWVTMKTPGVESWMVSWNDTNYIQLFKPGDKWEMMQGLSRVAALLGKMCKKGDLECLKAEINELRATHETPFNRPLAWVWLSSWQEIWKGAYENGHWNIIEYLVGDLGFDVTPPLWVRWNLPAAVADHAVETNSTEELQRLLDLGWDINSGMGQSPYNTWIFGGQPTLSRVCTNETLVRWYLSNGATPCPGSMSAAAREAPLPILKMLVQHSGKVEGTDLVADAALGDMWGCPDRVGVVDYLLGVGALIDGKARFRRPPEKSWYPLNKNIHDFDGLQTAYNIARISRNRELENELLKRGADTTSTLANIHLYPEITKRL